MNERTTHALPFLYPWLVALVTVSWGGAAVACGGDGEGASETTGAEAPRDEDDDTSGEEGLPAEPAAERAPLTAERCAEQGGAVVGDIGDGAVHRPDYRCANGEPPLGVIVPGAPDAPLGIEGAVCCGP